MGNPFVFFFKVIFDYLSYFLNFNGDVNELAIHQANYDVILGIIQNEVSPNSLTITFHNGCHIADSIVNCGDLITTSCLVSESSYQYVKKNIYSCTDPELTGGFRYLLYKISSSIAYAARSDCYNDPVVSKPTPPQQQLSFEYNKQEYRICYSYY